MKISSKFSPFIIRTGPGSPLGPGSPFSPGGPRNRNNDIHVHHTFFNTVRANGCNLLLRKEKKNHCWKMGCGSERSECRIMTVFKKES